MQNLAAWRRAAVCLGVALAAAAVGNNAQQPSAGSVAIEHVTLIDPATGARVADQTIVISGQRIAAVGPAAAARVPAGARVVDGRGRFLIPGMWDMHVHILHNLPRRSLPLYVTKGMTGVREMGGSIGDLAEARRLIDERLVAPRFVVSGPAVDGVPPPAFLPPGSDLHAASADEGRSIVHRLHAQRVDFIKVHVQVPKNTFLAIADEAKRLGLPFDGHVPAGMTIAEASDAGFRSIEHIGALAASCAANAADLTPAAPNATPAAQPIALDRRSCEDAISRLVKNGTWFTPTMGRPGTGNPRTRAFNLAVLRMAHERGLRLLAGTDGPGANYWRGDYSQIERSVQDEMAGMVEAGLSPLAALGTATVNPAMMLGMADQLGSVQAGKLADLVLLDADPLIDVANAKRIAAVVLNGRLIDAASRQKLIDEERAAQASGRTN